MSKLHVSLTGTEKILLVLSLLIVTGAYSFSGQESILTLAAALIGVTAVLFCAKGHIWGQILIILFSILYGIISFGFRYYGEMITYIGMCLPMAVWSLITWFRNPYEENPTEVKVERLQKKHYVGLPIYVVAVTIAFYFILRYLDTPNLWWSTLSVATSFLAAALTMLRSAYYAFWYALNDGVLIVLWIFAAMKDPGYIPVVVNFLVFLCNDLYGFISWKKREKRQRVEADEKE